MKALWNSLLALIVVIVGGAALLWLTLIYFPEVICQ